MEILLYWFFTLSGVAVMFSSVYMSNKAESIFMVVLGLIVMIGVQHIDFRGMGEFK